MDKIICLKLSTGEEIIGKLFNETAVAITLKDVIAVVMMPGQVPGQYGMGLVPFLPYAEDKTFDVNKSHIVIQTEPGLDMLNNYNARYGSGIQIASAI